MSWISNLYSFFRKEKKDSKGFNDMNPLGDGGERVDFIYTKDLKISNLDIYQRNHYERYKFANDIIKPSTAVGDMACGTGYGSVLLADKCKSVVGVDINEHVIKTIQKRYLQYKNVTFLTSNLLNINFIEQFDYIVSFETLEHFEEDEIVIILEQFHKSLKTGGELIFSTPYMQPNSEAALKMGFHLTYFINEKKIQGWLKESSFELIDTMYQSYEQHSVVKSLEKKEFILVRAKKI